MPTAAKLIAAFAFAMVAFFAANSVIPHLREGTQIGNFLPMSMAVGVIVGWRVSGTLAGKGSYTAAGAGLRTSILLVFWVLVIIALTEMTRNSIKLRYNGPADAVVSAFGIAAEYLQLIVFIPEVMAILLIGGILAAMLVEWTARRWS